jgi:zinc protease
VIVPGKTSVDVTWGMATGIQYRDPDALALRVAAAVLGSGFTGRLMANVRDKEGLTYGIYSYVMNDTFSDGDFRISATFAPTLLDKGVASARRQLELWHEKGISAAELAQRQRELVGNFQVNLATTGGLAQALLTTVQRGLELTWLDELPGRINALKLEQVNRAIHTHLDPAKMVIVEAGSL